MTTNPEEKGALWLTCNIVCGIVMAIVFWGLFLYFVDSRRTKVPCVNYPSVITTITSGDKVLYREETKDVCVPITEYRKQ